MHLSQSFVVEVIHVAFDAATIGFCPDVGTSHFAARMGGAGRYVAMTTTRLNAVDLMAAGLATHFVPSSSILALQEALLQCPGYLDIADVVGYCDKVLSSLSRPPTSVHMQPFESSDNELGGSFLELYQELIEHCFSASETVADIQIIFGACDITIKSSLFITSEQHHTIPPCQKMFFEKLNHVAARLQALVDMDTRLCDGVYTTKIHKCTHKKIYLDSQKNAVPCIKDIYPNTLPLPNTHTSPNFAYSVVSQSATHLGHAHVNAASAAVSNEH